MEIKGINYDTGIKYISTASTRSIINASIMEREIKIIKDELHCNAVRIYGDNLSTIIECSRIALKEGLTVWFSPRLINASPDEAIQFINTCSENAEQLRKEYSDIVFVIGTEFSLDIKEFIQGDTIYERISRMFKPASLIKNALGFGIRKKLNNFLSNAVLAARQNFKGDVTYAAGHWEKVNWDLFDIVSVNYYRNKFNASRYRDYIKKLVNIGKRTAITEFGCCSYIGADQKGAWGYSVVDRSSPVPKLNAPYERDENVQAKYINDLLKIFSEENVFAAFVFNFIVPNAPYNKVPIYDLDMANFGIVKVLPGKNTGTDEPYKWERKKAFYELSKFYSGY